MIAGVNQTLSELANPLPLSSRKFVLEKDERNFGPSIDFHRSPRIAVAENSLTKSDRLGMLSTSLRHPLN